jgi:hypothetical protein
MLLLWIWWVLYLEHYYSTCKRFDGGDEGENRHKITGLEKYYYTMRYYVIQYSTYRTATDNNRSLVDFGVQYRLQANRQNDMDLHPPHTRLFSIDS